MNIYIIKLLWLLGRSLHRLIKITDRTSGGRQAAISHNIIPFHAVYQLFCLPTTISHNRTVFHTTAFESSGSITLLYKLGHWNCDFKNPATSCKRYIKNFIFKFRIEIITIPFNSTEREPFHADCGVTPLGLCLRVIVNKKTLNIEKTTSSVPIWYFVQSMDLCKRQECSMICRPSFIFPCLDQVHASARSGCTSKHDS